MDRILKQFNWRFLLVRFLVNAIAVAITAAVTPKIYFVDRSIVSWVLITVMLGVLNALLKPVLQFLTLQFIFVTYGLVVVLVNALLLWLLSFLFPARFAVNNVWWALLGGLVLGVTSSFLESLLGLTMPIVPDEPPELRQQIEEQARHVDWLTAANREVAEEEQMRATEPPELEASAVDSAVAESAAAEPSTPGLDEGLPPPAELEGQLSDATAPPTKAAIPEGLEPAPEPGEGQEEDHS